MILTKFFFSGGWKHIELIALDHGSEFLVYVCQYPLEAWYENQEDRKKRRLFEEFPHLTHSNGFTDSNLTESTFRDRMALVGVEIGNGVGTVRFNSSKRIRDNYLVPFTLPRLST